MNKFDAKAKCPKCGNEIVGVRFLVKGEYRTVGDTIGATMDLLARSCRRCGYSWDELPLDGKKENP